MSEVKVNKISPRTNCGTVTLGDSGDSFAIATCASFKTKDVKDTSGNIIISRCGSNITIGSSGAAVALAAGATQSGFGRTGTVNWDTTAKTASFTAVSGEGYFINTTSGAITVSLPTGSAGAIVSLADYTNTWQTNNVTVTPDGSEKIGGVASSATLNTEGQSVTFVYVDATEGWKSVQDSTSNVTGQVFVTATGGTITTCGDYKIHTFTGPGTFTVTSTASNPTNNAVDYLVVAGGGGSTGYWGAAAGAGGFREGKSSPAPSYTASPLVAPAGITVTATGYPITVGAGGAAKTGCQQPPSQGNPGNISVFSTITSAGGGGGGGGYLGVGGSDGASGGSGGGAGGYQPFSGGAGNTPPVSPSQGNPGGNNPGGQTQGGGGGATAAGASGTYASLGGAGGAGAGTGINPSPTVGTPGPSPSLRYYAGGGGGGNGPPAGGPAGGVGGGGPGNPNGSGGTVNTGGGAGNEQYSGGSGIVVIRYKFQ